MKEDMINNVIKSLYESLLTIAGAFQTLTGGIEDLSSYTRGIDLSVMKGIGLSLFTLFFLMRFCESTLKDSRDPDALFKEIAWCIIFSTLILEIDKILPLIADIGIGIAQTVSPEGFGLAHSFGDIDLSSEAGRNEINLGEQTFMDTWGQKIKEQHDGWNIISLAMDVAWLNIGGSIVMSIIEIIIAMALWTVRIEVCIRYFFAPIGIALLGDSGWQGPGGRYIRGLLACFLQIGIMKAAGYIYLMVVTASSVSTGSFFAATMSGGLACAGICMKSSGLAKEITGAS